MRHEGLLTIELKLLGLMGAQMLKVIYCMEGSFGSGSGYGYGHQVEILRNRDGIVMDLRFGILLSARHYRCRTHSSQNAYEERKKSDRRMNSLRH